MLRVSHGGSGAENIQECVDHCAPGFCWRASHWSAVRGFRVVLRRV